MTETLPDLYRDHSGDIPDAVPADSDRSPNRKPRWRHQRNLQAQERRKYLYVQQYRLWGDSKKAREMCANVLSGAFVPLSRHVVQRWMDQDEDFRVAINAIDEMWYAIRHREFADLGEMSLMALRECIEQSADMRLKFESAKFNLKGQNIGRDTTEVRHVGPGGGPIQIVKVEYERLPPRERPAIEAVVVEEETDEDIS